MARFRLAPLAHADLEDIDRYTLETWGEDQRVLYITGLFEHFEKIAENPGLGRPRPELGEGVHSLPYERHVVFYELHADRCYVLRVLHERRDVARFFPSKPM